MVISYAERVIRLYGLGDAADDAAHPFARCQPALGINNYKTASRSRPSGLSVRGFCKSLT